MARENGSPEERAALAGSRSEEDDDGLEFYEPPKRVSSSRNFATNVVEQRQGKPEYKLMLLWHVLFKVQPDLVYIFSGLMGMGYISTFITVVTLLSVDFWFTKNISGRLLAGLFFGVRARGEKSKTGTNQGLVLRIPLVASILQALTRDLAGHELVFPLSPPSSASSGGRRSRSWARM